MHSDVSSTIYSESTMEPDNNHVFQPLNPALLFYFTHFFLSKAKNKQTEQFDWYFESVGWLSKKNYIYKL